MTVGTPGGSVAASVAVRTRESLGTLTASERKVARALLSAYPVAGLETVAQLSERAGVSPPTVIRFVARLGFPGYPAFQQALMHEVHERMGSPLAQYADKSRATAGKNLLPYAADTLVEGIRASFAELPEAEFAAAVDLLCDRRLRVHLLGGRFSRILADYLAAHLQLLRSDVVVVGEDEQSRLALVADGGKSQLLVVFDYRRYEPATVRLVELVARRGTRILLLTDPWLSPIAGVADVVLPGRVEAPSAFDSLVPALALVESLVAASTERLGSEGRERLELIEDSRRDLLQVDATRGRVKPAP